MSSTIYEDNVKIMEKGMHDLAVQREQYLRKAISPQQYEEKCEDIFYLMEEAFSEMRRTYLPIAMPSNLCFKDEPPAWLNIKGNQLKEYYSYTRNSRRALELLVRKFRRPDTIQDSVKNAAEILSFEQNKLYNEDLLKIFTLFSDTMKFHIRPNILLAKNANKKIVDIINGALAESEMEVPTTLDELSMLLLVLFGDDGGLEGGLGEKDLKAEVSKISASISYVCPEIKPDDIIESVLPFIATIHKNEVIAEAKSFYPEITAKFGDAVSLFGADASPGDFGEDGKISKAVSSAVSDIPFFDDIDQLAQHLQAAGEAVVKSCRNYRSARSVLAAAMVATQDVKMPQYFMAALRYCSGESLSALTHAPLFVMAFDSIISLIPDFD